MKNNKPETITLGLTSSTQTMQSLIAYFKTRTRNFLVPEKHFFFLSKPSFLKWVYKKLYYVWIIVDELRHEWQGVWSRMHCPGVTHLFRVPGFEPEPGLMFPLLGGVSHLHIFSQYLHWKFFFRFPLTFQKHASG